MNLIATPPRQYLFYPHYLFLLLVTFFIRFPFFFRDYIDRDESTFILLGKSITDGHLPYDHLWDLKPPLLFYSFAFVEYLFPQSLIAIRVFGVLIIFLSAVFLVLIAKQANLKNGFLIGLAYILLSSLFGSIQGVMSEHLAVFFLLPGLYFFLKNRNAASFFIAGVLFGCSLLCKINYSYTIVIIGLYYFVGNLRDGQAKKAFRNMVVHVTGILVPFVAIAILFVAEQKLWLFIDSVFLATLEYGHTERFTIWQKVLTAGWVITPSIIVSFLAIWKTGSNNNISMICVLMLMATVFTFFSSGTVNTHYLIQIHPFFLMIVLAILLPSIKIPKTWLLFLIIVFISFESDREYYKLFVHYKQSSTLYNGKTFTVLKELKDRKLDNKKIFFADYHIGYWFLDQYPLTKSTTHPSSITRPAFFRHFGNYNSPLQELQYLMDTVKPEVIVSRSNRLDFFNENSEEDYYFKKIRDQQFNLIYEDAPNKIFIWQRKENW